MAFVLLFLLPFDAGIAGYLHRFSKQFLHALLALRLALLLALLLALSH